MLPAAHVYFFSAVSEASEGLQGDHFFPALIIRPPDNRAEKVIVPQRFFALGPDTGLHVRLFW